MPSIIRWEGRDIDVDAQLNELDRVECEESLSTFLMHAWRFIDPAPYVHGWVIDALAEHLEAVCDGDLKRLLINIPPRMGKSSIISVAYPAWVWAQEHRSPTSGPGVPFLHASYAYKLAIRDSVRRRRLMKSTWYRNKWANRFNILIEQDQKVRFANDQGGESLITAVEAGVTGEGGNCIIVDDPNNAREVLSEAIIQSTNEDWWDGAMSTRLNDPKTGAVIVVQQRLGELDLTGHILAREPDRWTHLCLPMHYEPQRSFVTSIGWEDPRKAEGELLFPERFDETSVKELQASLKMWRAAGQLEQRPEPMGGGIIKRDWWQVWPPGGEDLHQASQLFYPPFDYIVASLDTAYTEKTINDPSALTVWGVFSGDVVAQMVQVAPGVTQRTYVETSNRVMLAHAWSEHLEIHPLVQRVHKTCLQFKVDMLLIEDKAAGLSVAQELRRLFATKDKAAYGVRVMRPIAGGGYTKNSKVARLYSVQNIFEEKMVYAPDRPYAEMVIAQCGTFPNGQHDDLVDTTSQALRFLRDSGMLIRGEERMSEAEEMMQHKGRPPPPLYPA